MTITIDADKALELLRAAVEQEGYEHTATCLYVGYNNPNESGEPEPLCIAGVALAPLLGTENLLKMDDDFGAFYTNTKATFTSITGVAMTAKAYRMFAAAQAEQDAGTYRVWGRALVEAERVYDGVYDAYTGS
jgi:hypothetical protein